jgi:hypothetical protein
MDALARVKSQLPIEDKCRMATLVVKNDVSEQELHSTLDNAVVKWKKRAWLTYLPDPLFLIGFLVAVVAIIVNLY